MVQCVELRKDVATFRHIDAVWVTSISCAITLAHALRAGMLEVAATKRSLDGRHDKMEVLYSYLSGPEFRHRVEEHCSDFRDASPGSVGRETRDTAHLGQAREAARTSGDADGRQAWRSEWNYWSCAAGYRQTRIAIARYIFRPSVVRQYFQL
jgi:hypothetical protein